MVSSPQSATAMNSWLTAPPIIPESDSMLMQSRMPTRRKMRA